ncbi:DUF1304 family protein [Streptomyces sp. NPDC003016]
MNVVSQVFAPFAAAVHIAVRPTESFLYGGPRIRVLLTGSTADAPEIRLWRFNVGFHSPFLALGLIAGIVALHLGHETAGRSPVTCVCICICASTIAGGIMLFVSGPTLWRGSPGQAPAPAVALAADLLRRSAHQRRAARSGPPAPSRG